MDFNFLPSVCRNCPYLPILMLKQIAMKMQLTDEQLKILEEEITMAKKKAAPKAVPPKAEYEKISSQSCVYERIAIPKDATHVEAELDYSSCYYESDQPYCMIHFYKKKD